MHLCLKPHNKLYINEKTKNAHSTTNPQCHCPPRAGVEGGGRVSPPLTGRGLVLPPLAVLLPVAHPGVGDAATGGVAAEVPGGTLLNIRGNSL